MLDCLRANNCCDPGARNFGRLCDIFRLDKVVAYQWNELKSSKLTQ